MDTPNTILIIDPHPARARFLRETLGDDYRYDLAYDLASGMTRIEEGEPDMILVAEDTSEPPLESWLRQVAFVYSVPTIVIAECEWPVERTVRLLEAGAAYHLARSDPLYLCAVVAQALRRVEWSGEKPTQSRVECETVGDMELEHPTRRVSFAGQSVRLSKREWDTFMLLVRKRGGFVPVRDIARVVTDCGASRLSSEDPAIVYARYYIQRVRLRLGHDRVITEPYVGYRLVLEAS